MRLGHLQESSLNEVVDAYERHPDEHRVVFKVSGYLTSGWIGRVHVRRKSGHDISVQLRHEDGDVQFSRFMSTCQDKGSAIGRAKEFARYTVDELGVPREHVSVKARR